ncbi:uncharacterized protein HD556DRAFT_1310749 [Suillus plorans]|uniref:Uncharacterized protein n=1 Tax=Suillus plorans TaxID=116603 RepID=A0A9P7AIP6_9AGAM|nr:uncharacterized protein HD556DRAFT_1310749 [Suillus plorans]KAG1790361.1 hypothetical protein HD556DRAFT_1310749 [Suillus plorans]
MYVWPPFFRLQCQKVWTPQYVPLSSFSYYCYLGLQYDTITIKQQKSCPNTLDSVVMNWPKSGAAGLIIKAVPLALHDNGAWEILRQFLTTSMSLSEMDDALVSYLGDQYSPDDWEEPRHLLFSDNANDAESLRNLMILWRRYIPDPAEKSSVPMPASRTDGGLSRSRIQKSHRLSQAARRFIADEADEADKEEGGDEEEEDSDGRSAQLPKVMHLPGPSAKERLAATFNDMASRFEGNPPTSPEDRPDPTHRAPQSRMYLMHVQRATTEHIAEHLHRKGFPITVSAWLAGQLYMVANSPKMVAQSLPGSLYLAVKEYTRITEEEREAVKRTQSELPNPVWLRIKSREYKGDMAQVFEQLPNGVVAVLIVARCLLR